MMNPTHIAPDEVLIVRGEDSVFYANQLSLFLRDRAKVSQLRSSDLLKKPDRCFFKLFILLEDLETELLLEKLNHWIPSSPVIVFSERRSLEKAIQYMRHGARDYLPLPPKEEQVIEVFEREVKLQRVEHCQVFKDDVTGLYNSRYLWIYLNEVIQVALMGCTPFGVIFLDLDDFKKVNDSYGHARGTEVIREVGALIRHCLRSTDCVFRYGGDEFVAVLTQLNLLQVEQVAARLQEAIEEHNFLQPRGLKVSVRASLGVAVFPQDGRSGLELIEAADQAMYRVKRERRFSSESLLIEKGIDHGSGKVTPTEIQAHCK